MKVLFLGCAISQETSNHIMEKSKAKPSQAPVNFQRNLLKGFAESICPSDMKILSLPQIASYPKGCFFSWGRRREKIFDYEVFYIPTVNLPVFKQISAFFSALFLCIGWGIKNRKEKEKAVLVYGQTPYIALAQVLFCKLFRVKSCDIVTDPIRYRSDMDSIGVFKRGLIRLQWAVMDAIKRQYSSFVLLTEKMVGDYIRRGTPYLLLEGIADVSIFDGIGKVEKAQPPVVMYCGALTGGFGIPKLLKCFSSVRDEARLWLFGSGDCVGEIQQAQKENPHIRYWGKVPWQELLTHMKEATVLLSIKPVDEAHSGYQFPSKIMEYMASGTPVLSTRVPGIPEEYFQYIYPIEEDTEEGFALAINGVLNTDSAELAQKGEKARVFLAENKNCYKQAERILSLLKETVAL